MLKSNFLDLSTKRYVDLFYILLVHSNKYSLLPELYEVFGREKLIDFLELFAGSTIEVPSTDELASKVRDIDVYHKLLDSDEENFGKTCRELAYKYETDLSTIYKINDSMVALMDKYNFKSIKKKIGNV